MFQDRRNDLSNSEPNKIKTQTNIEKQCKQKGKKSILIKKVKKAPKQTLAFDLGLND